MHPLQICPVQDEQPDTQAAGPVGALLSLLAAELSDILPPTAAASSRAIYFRFLCIFRLIVLHGASKYIVQPSGACKRVDPRFPSHFCFSWCSRPCYFANTRRSTARPCPHLVCDQGPSKLANALGTPPASLLFDRGTLQPPADLDNKIGRFFMRLMGFYSHRSQLLHGARHGAEHQHNAIYAWCAPRGCNISIPYMLTIYA